MIFAPHDYQRKAIRWIMDKPRCALFAEMGLGKTVITLTALKSLRDDFEVQRVLIVAPKKVAESTWSTEADKWDHLRGLTIATALGDVRQRRSAVERGADITVTGRDNFTWLWETCGGKQWPFDTLVLDELTSFKNSTSKRFKAMRHATAVTPRVIGLTGTPAPNGYADLWAQMCCIDGGERLGKSKTRYLDNYFYLQKWGNVTIRCTPRPGACDAISAKISDVCLTLRAADYLEMPDMIVRDFMVVLPPPVRKKYDDFERNMVMDFARAQDGGETEVIATSAAALMTKLSQMANGAVYDVDHNPHEEHGEKLEALKEIVEGASGGVLVFYHFQSDVSRIHSSLKGYRVEVYEGPASLERWNHCEIDVLLAHPASTAYGLNMQAGGHTIVWFGLGWNLELYQQANARLHRQGQTHPVIVHRLLCAGTVDERARDALTSKDTMQSTLMTELKKLIDKHKN